MDRIFNVSKYLTQNAEQLASEIVPEIIQRFKVDIPKDEVGKAISMYTEFLGFLGESLTTNEEKVPDRLIEWSKENGEREAAYEGRISDIIIRYPDTRLVFTDRIMNISVEHGLTIEEVVSIIKRVNYLLDISINETVFAYERLSDKILQYTRAELNELSAPVVPIQDDIAVLPLIGSIDYDRAKLIMEKVVPKIAQLKVECLIIDFSGIASLDAEIAKYIFDIHSVLRLLGVKSIATGVRSDLAQKVVTGGIDLSSIETYATVKQAIESLKQYSA